MEGTVFQLVAEAGYVVKAVMVLLLFFSVVSWAIIFFKYRYLSAAQKESATFMKTFSANASPKALFAHSKRLTLSPIASVFLGVYTVGKRPDRDELRRKLRRYETLAAASLERHLNFLATTGSITPFIGLFGTVWGIMNSFMGIGAKGSASLAVVGPGIAEALIATAMGLAAAIPAVIAYNYYLSRARHMTIEMEDFSEEILDLLGRKDDEDK